MRPSRPLSRRAAASSARVAGADPSYPTTRYRFPVDGITVFIETPGFFQAAEGIVVQVGAARRGRARLIGFTAQSRRGVTERRWAAAKRGRTIPRWTGQAHLL